MTASAFVTFADWCVRSVAIMFWLFVVFAAACSLWMCGAWIVTLLREGKREEYPDCAYVVYGQRKPVSKTRTFAVFPKEEDAEAYSAFLFRECGYCRTCVATVGWYRDITSAREDFCRDGED